MKILLKKELENTFLKFKVDLPDNVDGFEIIHKKDGRNVLDIGIERNGEFLGYSGGSKEVIRITNHGNTNGYLKSDLDAEFIVVVYFYKVTDEMLEVEIEVNLLQKEMNWLKGVTHMHSLHSDGKLGVHELVSKGIENELDYLCFTDHNNFSQNYEIKNGHEQMVLIPGFELTTKEGHCNFLGLTKPLEEFGLDKINVRHLINEASNNGALVTINHPFCENCGWEDKLFSEYLIEIWNEPWYKNNSQKNNVGVMWLEDQIKLGNKPIITGGSDFHKYFDNTNSLVNPLLYCYCYGKSQESILYSMKNGRSYIKNENYELEFETNFFDKIGNLVENPWFNITSKIELEVNVIKPSGNLKYITKQMKLNIELDTGELCFVFLKDLTCNEGVLLTNIIRRI